MLKLWLSPKLYKLLPLGYLVAGLLMFVTSGEGALGRISGLLLCAAGVLVLVLRLIGRTTDSSRRRGS